MYVFEISIENKTDCGEDVLFDQFGSMLAYLYRNGQISKGDSIFGDKTGLKAIVDAHEKSSLMRKYGTEQFRLCKSQLERLAGSKIVCRVLGRTLDGEEVCRCKSRSFLVLFAHYLQTCASLACGDCHGIIPLYRIPKIKGYSDHIAICLWAQNYRACDRFNMNCEFAERWAIKQMSDPNSSLSKEGMSLCREIEEVARIPTFYYFYNCMNIRIEQDQKRTCPICRKNGYKVNNDFGWNSSVAIRAVLFPI